MKNRYMLDIETLGTRPGSVVFEIGCVLFDEHRIINGFEVIIDIENAKTWGLFEEPETLAWWEK